MKLVVVKGSGGKKEFRLHDGMNHIGRGITNRIRLVDPRVSRNHCKIRKVGLSLYLSDLGTKNGTQVNGESVSERELQVFDEIRIGKTLLKVVHEDYVVEAGLQKYSGNFFSRLIASITGKSPERTENAREDFAKFAPKIGRRFWRPRLDTEPPEADSETVFSHTDPDS